jgi:hypothetical protein
MLGLITKSSSGNFLNIYIYIYIYILQCYITVFYNILFPKGYEIPELTILFQNEAIFFLNSHKSLLVITMYYHLDPGVFSMLTNKESNFQPKRHRCTFALILCNLMIAPKGTKILGSTTINIQLCRTENLIYFFVLYCVLLYLWRRYTIYSQTEPFVFVYKQLCWTSVPLSLQWILP